MKKLILLGFLIIMLGCEPSNKKISRNNWFNDPMSPGNISNPSNPISPLNPTNPTNPSNILWK